MKSMSEFGRKKKKKLKRIKLLSKLSPHPKKIKRNHLVWKRIDFLQIKKVQLQILACLWETRNLQLTILKAWNWIYQNKKNQLRKRNKKKNLPLQVLAWWSLREGIIMMTQLLMRIILATMNSLQNHWILQTINWTYHQNLKKRSWWLKRNKNQPLFQRGSI